MTEREKRCPQYAQLLDWLLVRNTEGVWFVEVEQDVHISLPEWLQKQCEKTIKNPRIIN